MALRTEIFHVLFKHFFTSPSIRRIDLKSTFVIILPLVTIPSSRGELHARNVATNVGTKVNNRRGDD